jgi:hypothetical protein
MSASHQQRSNAVAGSGMSASNLRELLSGKQAASTDLSMLTSNERATVTMASESTFGDTMWQTLPADMSGTGFQLASEETEQQEDGASSKLVSMGTRAKVDR